MKNKTYTWRVVPDVVECLLDVLPRAPVPINTSSIVVSGLIFTNSKLEFTAIWDPPSTLYGAMLVIYEIYVGQNYLAASEDTEDHQNTLIVHEIMVSSHVMHATLML